MVQGSWGVLRRAAAMGGIFEVGSGFGVKYRISWEF